MAIDLRDKTGGGGTVPINSPICFDEREDKIIDGVVEYLKTGVVETDWQSYPKFPVKFYNTNVTFTPSVGDNIAAITSGGGFLWVYVTPAELMYKLNEDGTPTGTVYSLLGAAGSVAEMTYSGGFLYVAHTGTNRPIVKYALDSGSGVSSFDTNEPSDLKALGSDGNHLYTINIANEFKKYTFGGSLVSTVQLSVTYNHLVWDGEYFLTNLGDSKIVYLNTSGEIVYKTGHAPWVTAQSTTGFTISADGEKLFFSVSADVFIYEKGVYGSQSPAINNANALGGSTVYWRIK